MSLYAHMPVRTADLWKKKIFLFPESIFIINSVKCLVKKISELDHKVSVPGAMPVVSVASKYQAKNRW